MKKSRILSTIVAAALAAVNMATFAALPAAAEEVDLDGTYHAYIGVQSASYTFRNAYDDATYGYGVVADDGTVWFDQLTGWDGPTAVNKPTTFNDCEITGNGTYTVSMSDFDFGEDETLNLLYLSTDIPLNDTISFSDVKIKMDGNTKYTFTEALLDPDAKEYMKALAINIWNDDLGKAEGLFGYMMPTDKIEIEFTVSGFNKDAAAPADNDTATAGGDYNAYIGVQSASYTFRNAYDDATYGYGVVADDGTVWFDQLTGWDGPTAVNKPTTFNDCKLDGNGTYTVSMTDFDFGEDETLNLLYISTNIPLDSDITFSDIKVKMDGNTKYTFTEGYVDPDAQAYKKYLAINIWNDDLGKAEGLFGYMMPADKIEFEFTVSGFDYDNTAAPAEEEVTTPAETEAVTEAITEAAETEAAATEAAPANTTVEDSSSSSSALPIIIVVIVVVVIAVVAFVVIKNKKA